MNTQVTENKKQKIFKSPMPSFRYFFKNGVAAIFMNGRYTTDNKQLEAELMAEVGEIGRSKSLNPYIYVDEAEPEFDPEALSPLELIKQQSYEQARKDILEEMAAQHARAMDAGANVSSTAADFKSSLNTTAKIAEVTSESNGVTAGATAVQVTGLAARLANLAKSSN